MSQRGSARRPSGVQQLSEARLLEEYQQARGRLRPVAAVSLSVVDGRVARVDMVINPDKLARTCAPWKENP